MPNRPMTEQELAASRKLTAYLNEKLAPEIMAALNADYARHGAADARGVQPHRQSGIDHDPGRGRSAEWEAEDGWLIGYSTTRIEGGRWDGKFIVTAHRPTGRGARSGRGKPERWEIAYSRAFATRKAAKARAVELYRRHSPKWATKIPPRDAK